MGSLDLKKRRNKMNHTNAIGSNWKDVRKELFTREKFAKVMKELKRLVKQLKNKRKNSKRKKIRNFCKR